MALHSVTTGAGALAVVLALTAAPALAQGKSGVHAAGPKVSAPTQTGKPATPPGQTRQPPAGARAGAVKPVTPLVVKPALAARLQPMLPSGTTVEAAAAGFGNLGQFVAAVHASQNLDIPFATLKTQLVDQQRSLGRAIQDLKPEVNAKTEVERAETQARADLNDRAAK